MIIRKILIHEKTIKDREAFTELMNLGIYKKDKESLNTLNWFLINTVTFLAVL